MDFWFQILMFIAKGDWKAFVISKVAKFSKVASQFPNI